MGDFWLRLVYLCTIACSLYTSGWLIFKAGRSREVWTLAACQLLVMVWCIPLLFTEFLTTTALKYLAYGISYVGISFIGPGWLEFSFGYCRKKLPAWGHAALFGISACSYAMFLSNESHHLFYSRFSVEAISYGPVFYFHMIYTYLCVLWGMAVVLGEFSKKRVAPGHVAVILLAAAVPLGFNVLYLSGAVKSGFDLTPPAFAWSVLLMLAAVFRYDLLDVNAMAFEDIFSSIAEGVVIYNSRGEITFCNQAAESWLGIKPEDGYAGIAEAAKRLGAELAGAGQEMAMACAGQEPCESESCEEPEPGKMAPRPERKPCEPTPGPGDETSCVGPGKDAEAAAPPPVPRYQEISLADGTRLRFGQYVYRNKNGRMTAGALLLTDVSSFYGLLEKNRELEAAGRSLAVEQERNRIAQEVHDTTGHTLTMIQSLLRLMRVEIQELQKLQNKKASEHESPAGPGAEETERLFGYAAQAQELVSEGIRELRFSINQMHRREDATVTESVQSLADSVRGLEVVTEFQGTDGPEYAFLSAVVYGVLKEAVTNCLKYAEASRMDVIVKFEKARLSLYIFDNGKGCEKIRESNGIRGIRSRTEKAGGTVRFLSAAGEGFQIYLSVPV